MGGGNPIKKIEETVKKASRDVEKERIENKNW